MAAISWRGQWTGGQWLAATLVAAMIVTGGLALVQQAWLRPPLLVDGDYAPFASLAEYQAFYQQHPLLTKQAPDAAHFYYRASVSARKQPVYQIYLLELPVKPGNAASFERYTSSLLQFQQEAKRWFANHGEKLDAAYVQWYPDPANLAPTVR